ncbi:MAG: D-aminoacylase [Pseudomonadota bacterium]
MTGAKLSMYDIVIRDGLIVDGTGQPGKRGDVAISGDKIFAVGEFPDIQGKRVISAQGYVVAPGFIDIHSHSDFTLLANPGVDGKVCQGVTTELVGQCGASGAPMEGPVREKRRPELEAIGLSITWSTMDEYLSTLEETQPIVNVATLVGHGNIRGAVVGYENRPLLRKELKQMEALVIQSMEMGAFGLSTGLIYPPGVYSSTDELILLTKAVAKFGGIYATHLRSEGDRLIEAIEEALTIAERAGVSLQISHLKTNGKKNWSKLPAVFQVIENAITRGINVHGDRYPYTASSTDLDVLLPSWAWEGGREKELGRLAAPECQEKITKELLAQDLEPDFWNTVVISTVHHEKNRHLEGKTLAEIAGERNSAPWKVLYELLIEEDLRVNAIFFSMSEENLTEILARDYIMIGTDSAARSLSGLQEKGKPHPRGFGTYPRILSHWAGEGKLLSLETAICKMTGLPAKKVGLKGRGLIKAGYCADLVILDPSTIQDRADYHNPFQSPVGIEHVMVNGEEVIAEGKLTGKRPGRVIRREK